MSTLAVSPTLLCPKAVPAERGAGVGAFYHPELDALRFLAFLAVFVHHALPNDLALYTGSGVPEAAARWLLTAKGAGAYGVDLFFTLSAYLITELLVREHLSRGRINVWAFYARRALRIWPLYFTALAAAVLLAPRVLPAEEFGPVYVVSFALFAGNWACAWWGLPFSVANPLWSVSIEEQFYLAWPLLLLCCGVGRIRHLALAMLAVACGARIILAATGTEHPGVWCNTFARLDPIACGALLAVGLRGGAPALGAAARLALCGGGLAVWLLVTKYLQQDGPTSLVTYPAVAAGSLMLLVAALRPEAPLLRRAPLSCLVYLGRISYGLYVFHLFALAFMAQQLTLPLVGVPLNFEQRVACAFVLTVLLAAASYRWLEGPFLRLKGRFSYAPAGGAAERTRPTVAVDEGGVLSGGSRA